MKNRTFTGILGFGFIFIILAIGYLLFGIFGIMVFESKLTISQRVFLAIMGGAFLILGLGILKLKEWARKVTFLLSGYFILSILKQDLIPLFIKRERDLFLYIYYSVFLFICISPIVYFARRKVRDQFKKIN